MAIAQKRAQTITATTGGTFNLPNNTVPGTPTVFAGNTATKNQNVYGATGPFTIKLGTGHVNNVYFTGGNQLASSVTGLAGNDSLYLRGGAHGTYTVNMGTGQNLLSLGNAWGTVAYNNTNAAATTFDTLDVSNVTTNFTSLSLTATTGAVATTNGAMADAHSFKNLILGSGTATVVLNNLDDTLTFGNGAATVTGGATGDDTYAFRNFTGAANVTHTITDAGGKNQMDFSATTSNVAVTLTSATGVTALINGTGAGLGHNETVNFSGAGGIDGFIGGSGNDTFTVGNTAGTHSINGGTGNNTLVYTGSQGVTLDVRDHELSNLAATTDITFHAINTYKLLGGGSNTFIGDGTAGVTIFTGNGNTLIDAGAGSAATIHSDMGGNTTVVLGNGYGANVVTNTAGNGVLTLDASALTHAFSAPVTLGVGTATLGVPDVQMTDGQASVTSVAWGTASKVTGFIGNDMNTVVTGTGNYDFHITTGAGDDTITASGTANSVISTGNGNDAVTIGTGNNTVILGSGTDTVTATAGAGNNSIFTGSGTSTIDLGLAGTGKNIIDFSNGGTHTVTVGTNDNIFQGFYSNSSWAVTITDAANNLKGTLDLSNYNTTDIVWADTPLSGGNVADLTVSLDANHTILINDYFDGTHTTAAASTAGTGAIKTLHFADADLTFAQVKALATTAAFV